ncbi:MAG: SMP-30/gluconolactonase/LRE family protein [Bryobacteraceae bacterium]|nr:SMP-30/gluconolactonase/LRE family protein [Bryobacteraceae bacterium]
MTRIVVALVASTALFSQTYSLGPDSQRKTGVPRGTVTEGKWTSQIFPGTVRSYWVYAPAQYDPQKPAPVMIFQDGAGFVKEDGAFRATVVLDNLIAAKELPTMIGIFVDPGVLPSASANQEGRYNRSYEYDSVSDRYAHFLIDELLPEVGKKYNLSKDPNDRGLAGSSSGGIAAFAAAWNRPDAFRRVLSFIGSYTNLKGANAYPSLIRKMEPKPLRVFLQDGNNDLNIYSGSWWMANQDMASALQYAGYEMKFEPGTEGHNSKHGSAILPEALRWLWEGYPRQISGASGAPERHYIREILDPTSDWELVSEGHQFTEGPAVDKEGNFFFVDARKGTIHSVDSAGKVRVFAENTGFASGLMFGPDGRLYAAGRNGISVYDSAGKASVIAEGTPANDLAVSSKGEIYFTDPASKKVWFVDRKGVKKTVHEGLIFANGVRLSADESLLMVADSATRSVWSFQLQPDGSLINGEPFYRLEIAEEPNSRGLNASADGMAIDTEGYLYVATSMGIQICDQPGRVVGIIRKPGISSPSNVAFGGPDRKTFYVTAGDKVFKRKLRRTGVLTWAPVKPPKPRL